MHRSTAMKARPTGITASAAARRSGSAISNGLSWCTRLPRRSIRSAPGGRLRSAVLLTSLAEMRLRSAHRRFPGSPEATDPGALHRLTLLSNLYLNEADKMLERAREVTRNGKYTNVEYARF